MEQDDMIINLPNILLNVLYSYYGMLMKWIKHIEENGFDPPPTGLWAEPASTAPLCLITHWTWIELNLAALLRIIGFTDLDIREFWILKFI